MVKAQLNITIDEEFKEKIVKLVVNRKEYRSVSHFVECCISDFFEKIEENNNIKI